VLGTGSSSVDVAGRVLERFPASTLTLDFPIASGTDGLVSIVRLVKRVLIWTRVSIRMPYLRLASTALSKLTEPCQTRTNPQTNFAFPNLFISPRPNPREGPCIRSTSCLLAMASPWCCSF
jgi:hypothetical protein